VAPKPPRRGRHRMTWIPQLPFVLFVLKEEGEEGKGEEEEEEVVVVGEERSKGKKKKKKKHWKKSFTSSPSLFFSPKEI